MNCDNIIGKRFGRWLVTEYAGKIKKLKYWFCECDCGNTREVREYALVSGCSKSCGCLAKERARDANTIHGMTKTKFYRVWVGMKDRCSCNTTKVHENYGGRGIEVCQEWEDFENFYNDMFESYEEGLELDRIDVNGNYCKENCRWVCNSEQVYNQRKRKTNKSGKTGVVLKKATGKWCANIGVNGKYIHLGYFENIEDAIRVRESAELEFYGYNRP